MGGEGDLVLLDRHAFGAHERREQLKVRVPLAHAADHGQKAPLHLHVFVRACFCMRACVRARTCTCVEGEGGEVGG